MSSNYFNSKSSLVMSERLFFLVLLLIPFSTYDGYLIAPNYLVLEGLAFFSIIKIIVLFLSSICGLFFVSRLYEKVFPVFPFALIYFVVFVNSLLANAGLESFLYLLTPIVIVGLVSFVVWYLDCFGFEQFVIILCKAFFVSKLFLLFVFFLGDFPKLYHLDRYFGTFSNANHAAVYYSLIFSLSFYYVCYVKFNARIIIMLLISLFLLIETGSRTGLLGVIVTILFFCLNFMGSALRLLFVYLAISSLILIIIVFGVDWIYGTYGEDTRTAVLISSFMRFLESPIYGSLSSLRFSPVENSYVAVLELTGLVGFFLTLISISIIGIRLVRSSKKSAIIVFPFFAMSFFEAIIFNRTGLPIIFVGIILWFVSRKYIYNNLS